MPPVASDFVASIERGSVFLHACWSGPSVLALQRLQHAWSAAEFPDSELHVIDWGEHSFLGALPELSGSVHGWGEAFHVRSGYITHFHVLGRNHTTVDREILRFLEQARNI